MKKKLSFLYLPLTELALVPLLMYLCLICGAYELTISKQIAVAVYIFLGGFLFSKIENKVKNASSIFTAVGFVGLALFTIWCCKVSDQGDFAGMFFLPATYVEYFFDNDTMLSNVLLAVTAPLPVLLAVISSKLFEIKKSWTKIVAIIVALALVLTGGINIFRVVKSNYEYGTSLYGGETYFDVRGNEYEEQEDVPYYDKDGNKYSIVELGETNELYTSYAIVDEKGNQTVLDDFDDDVDVYIGTDGYIFIDNSGFVDYRSDIPSGSMTAWQYCNKDGDIYANLWSPHDYKFMRNGTVYPLMDEDTYRTK